MTDDITVAMWDELVPSGFSLLEYPTRRCGVIHGAPVIGINTLVCAEGAVGRFLYVYRSTIAELLLCEVEAYGEGEYYVLVSSYERSRISLFRPAIPNIINIRHY